jgi:hypothetical protein
MPLRFHTVLLLIALLWQSLGILNHGLAVQRGEQLEHWMVHAQETAHHHHADRSLHVDEENAPVTVHQHVDGGTADAAFLITANTHFAEPAPTAPATPDGRPYHPPHLEGLFRPPQIRA